MASQHLEDAEPSRTLRLSRWLSDLHRRFRAPYRPELHSMLSDLHRRFRDPYRPELHYMRGPGPKWHEKQAAASGQAPAPSP